MKSLFILLLLALTFSCFVFGQSYEYPVDPRLIDLAPISVPHPSVGVGQNPTIDHQETEPIDKNLRYLFEHSLLEQNDLPSADNHPDEGPERVTLNPLYHSRPSAHIRDFYVFEAPEEPELSDVTPLPPPPVRTKVIFIKAPSPAKTRIESSRPRDRTVVYVLVKKPDEPEIEISSQNIESPKPEVYFVHYKSRKNAFRNGPDEENSEDDSVQELEVGEAFRGTEGPYDGDKRSVGINDSVQELEVGEPRGHMMGIKVTKR